LTDLKNYKKMKLTVITPKGKIVYSEKDNDSSKTNITYHEEKIFRLIEKMVKNCNTIKE
jgi:hypothetical protein